MHVKFETPKELQDQLIITLEKARETGKIRKGTNETTKAIEKGKALLVVIAEDVEPPEVVAHLPILCKEKKVPYLYLPNKKQLGRAVGIEVSSAAIAVIEAGNAEKEIKGVSDKLKTLGLN
ncbi:MAG: 50S ribosomal protein L7ae [Candidatus Lokiarchaeota archaeon]|nr:50S ribosomal protein L7ae [Candidatus Lokiarchaeota archaeon]